MASFTDNIQALSTFNPYVEQQPVEAMVKVGMQKQQQYEEGYQKIQSSIDRVAGLDIVRDVDKNYLQAKLNALGNNLKTVAAGDFSSFQLTNSVAGMASKVAQDDNVINAVSSTSKYRKGLEEMAAAKKAGKSNASNEWLYKYDAAQWLDNPELSAQFNSSFEQYSDYKKNAQEVVKALAKNSTENDVAFEYDKQGNITSVLDAITRTKISEITPERIQEALKVGLSSSDWRQMQIDGRYNYSNETSEGFINRINTTYQTHMKDFNSQKQTLVNSLTSTTNVAAQQNIKNQIKQMDNIIEKVKNDYESISETFASGDAESAKARLYTNNWVDSFSKTFSSADYSQTQHSNPSAEMGMRRAEKRQAWVIHQQDLQQRADFHKDDVYLKQLDIEQKAIANQLKVKELGGYGAIAATLNKDEAPSITYDNVLANQGKLENNINYQKSQLIKQYRGTIPAGTSLAEATRKTVEDEKWLNEQMIAYAKNPKSFSGDANLSNTLATLAKLDQDHLGNAAMIANLENEANAIYPVLQTLIPKDSKTLNITLSTGGKLAISPLDFVNYNEKRSKVMEGSRSGVTFNDREARSILTPAEYKIYEIEKKKYTRQDLNAVENVIFASRDHYAAQVNQKYRKTLNERKEFIGNKIKEKVGMMQGDRTGIPLGSPALKDSFKGALTGWAENAEALTGLAQSPGVTKTSLLKIAGNLSSANVLNVPPTQFSPGYQRITVTDTKGVSNSFNITNEDYQSVFRGKLDATPEVKAFRPIEQQMLWMSSGNTPYATTALDNNYKTTPTNSYLNPTNFVGVSSYTVTGNVVEGTKGSGMYQFRLNVYDPVTKQTVIEDYPFPIGGLMDKSKVAPTMSQISDYTIFQLINNRIPSPAEMKKLKEASEQQ